MMRVDGLDMLPFGLNMTGCVKPTKYDLSLVQSPSEAEEYIGPLN